MTDSQPNTDTITKIAIAEKHLKEVDQVLADGLFTDLPDAISEPYSDKKTELWEFRNWLTDLRIFLEKCEDEGVLNDVDGEELVEDWVHSPSQAEEKYLDESTQ